MCVVTAGRWHAPRPHPLLTRPPPRRAYTPAGKKKSGTPPLKKPVSAELGCVSPVVVVPGEWSEEDLRHKALEVCRNVAGNASCNCLAMKARVMIDRMETQSFSLVDPIIIVL